MFIQACSNFFGLASSTHDDLFLQKETHVDIEKIPNNEEHKLSPSEIKHLLSLTSECTEEGEKLGMGIPHSIDRTYRVKTNEGNKTFEYIEKRLLTIPKSEAVFVQKIEDGKLVVVECKHVFRLNIQQSLEKLGIRERERKKERIGSIIRNTFDLMIKSIRTDTVTVSDTLVTRVRQGRKIQKYLEANKKKYGDHVEVVEEYLYARNGEIFVISQRLPLSTLVVKKGVPDKYWEKKEGIKRISSNKKNDTNFSQDIRYDAGAEERALSPIQAEFLAQTIRMGVTDVTYDNLLFTQRKKSVKPSIINTEIEDTAYTDALPGEPQEDVIKLAIVDTEVELDVYKNNHLFNKWIRDSALFELQISLFSYAILKGFCSDPEAIKQVEKVETSHVLWTMGKTVAKIALACLGISFIPAATAALPLGVAVLPVQYTLFTVTTYKITELFCSAIFALRIWRCSRTIQGLEENGEQEYKAMEKIVDWRHKERVRVGLA
jgi:hypothetical protein